MVTYCGTLWHVASRCSKMNKLSEASEASWHVNEWLTRLLVFLQGSEWSVLLPNTRVLCGILASQYRIKLIQRRVTKIIFTDCAYYTDACQLVSLPSLVDRREQLTRRFFSRIRDANNCLHYLLPEQRDSRITNSVRTAKKYPISFAKTTRFYKLVYSLCFSKLSVTLVI